MNTSDLQSRQLKALANAKRFQIIEWILDPLNNFEPQIDGDLLIDGVCIGRIVEKINLRQPTVTSHMKVLENAELVSSKKIKNWVFYKPDRQKIKRLFRELEKKLL